ncbi:MAG: thioredoxin family protein [Bacteroidota bacterium]|nr:thioredoxin family protein [Bacteroidota bacterium]
MNKLKLFFLPIIAFLLSATLCYSQNKIPKTVPAFKMLLSNGSMFSSKELSHQKPLIIIYFAPDCEHCQVLMNEFFKRIDDFKKAQIVMATFEAASELTGFEKKYETSKYPNIKVGTETPVFFFRVHYNLQHTPFTALFDKRGKLIVSYKEHTPVDDLIKQLKMLK